MPIYAYQCSSCGFAKDVLQKISDTPLSVCPKCDQPSFTKQVTAAGFQLKGSGWYVTDFRGGASPSTAVPAAADAGKSDAAAPASDAASSSSAAASSTPSSTGAGSAAGASSGSTAAGAGGGQS